MGRPPRKTKDARPEKPEKPAKRERPDRRRMTSMFVLPEIMDSLKKAAIDEKRTVYEIVEDAVTSYLKKRKRL